MSTKWLAYQLERTKALRGCRSIPLVCGNCGHVVDKETPATSEGLDELKHLNRELREDQEVLRLYQRARALFDRFPHSHHPVRVQGLCLVLADGSKGEPDPAFEAAMHEDAELAEWLCPSQGSRTGYSPKGHEMAAQRVVSMEEIVRGKPELHCSACGLPALEIPEDFIQEKVKAARRLRAVPARKLKESGKYPLLSEVLMTPDPARYYTEENDHNPLVILECIFCEGTGQCKSDAGDRAEDGLCEFCLGVGTDAEKPTRRFFEESAPVDVLLEEDGWLTCPCCMSCFRINDSTEWTGRRHQLCGQKINPIS